MRQFLPPVWPFNVTGQLPSSADQIFRRKSAPPLRTTFPEGKNLQVFTSEMCPWRSCCKRRKTTRKLTLKARMWEVSAATDVH